MVEEESRIEKLAQQKPRKFEESEKSQKSIKSMIVTDKNDSKNDTKSKKDQKKSVKIAEETVQEFCEPENDLDEQKRMENLRKLSQKAKKSPKSPNPKSPKSGKKSTTWDPVVYGGKLSKAEMENLDRTVGKPEGEEETDIHFNQYVPNKDLVGRSAQLEDVEYEDDDEEILMSNSSSKSGGGMFSMFSNLVGNKALTREDLEPVLAKLKDNLIAKNVASEVATSLIESVMVKLEGSVMGTFQSLARTVKDALTQSLMKLLTPKRRIDILRDVLEAKENKKPYVITFCGVNGVRGFVC